jgi:hypothetical protein
MQTAPSLKSGSPTEAPIDQKLIGYLAAASDTVFGRLVHAVHLRNAGAPRLLDPHHLLNEHQRAFFLWRDLPVASQFDDLLRFTRFLAPILDSSITSFLSALSLNLPPVHCTYAEREDFFSDLAMVTRLIERVDYREVRSFHSAA